MSKHAKITILGCGNSTGVPAIGNYWGDCDPNEPKNNRTRCSIAIKTPETTIIVDTGPNFREQINRENIKKIDGVLYSHMHSDHVHGIDELRVVKFRNKTRVPIYGNKETLDDLKHRFDYLFKGGRNELYPPILETFELNEQHFNRKQQFNDIDFTPFEQDHGTIKSVGYRFGDCAYSVDILNLDKKAINVLKGINTWIVDAAAYKKNDSLVHAGIKRIYELNDQINAQDVILTSLSLTMDYKILTNELKEGYRAAYDGLNLKISL